MDNVKEDRSAGVQEFRKSEGVSAMTEYFLEHPQEAALFLVVPVSASSGVITLSLRPCSPLGCSSRGARVRTGWITRGDICAERSSPVAASACDWPASGVVEG